MGMVDQGEISVAATNTYWKDDITDLKSRAQAVLTAPATKDLVSPRAAAACLSGIVGLVSRRFSLDVAQRTCAELVRSERSWETSFGALPHQNGYYSEATQLIACVARSLLPICGAANLRAALAFWASEDDVSVWQNVAAAG